MGHRDIPVLATRRLTLEAPRPEDDPNTKARFASCRSRLMGDPSNSCETWNRPDRGGNGFALEATHEMRNHFDRSGWDRALSHFGPKKTLDSVRLGTKKDSDAVTIAGSDAMYRHLSAAARDGTRLAHGVEMEVAHCADPLFKPKGWARD